MKRHLERMNDTDIGKSLTSRCMYTNKTTLASVWTNSEKGMASMQCITPMKTRLSNWKRWVFEKKITFWVSNQNCSWSLVERKYFPPPQAIQEQTRIMRWIDAAAGPLRSFGFFCPTRPEVALEIARNFQFRLPLEIQWHNGLSEFYVICIRLHRYRWKLNDEGPSILASWRS